MLFKVAEEVAVLVNKLCWFYSRMGIFREVNQEKNNHFQQQLL